MPPVLLPADLDPMRDQHGIDIANALPLRDIDTVAMPDLTYVFIVFSNRSGSTYLGHLLASTGFFNGAGEPLNATEVLRVSAERGWQSFAQYFAGIAGLHGRHGHFVLKSSIGQLSVLTQHGILPRILDRSRFIVVERVDKLAQAISWRIALATNRFTSRDKGTAPPPDYDAAQLRNGVEFFVDSHALIDRFMVLNGLVPFHVTYEALAAYPRLVGKMLCDDLGQPTLECDPSKVRLERQATELNGQWRARFLAEEAARPPSRPRPLPLPQTRHYQRTTLAELAADPQMRVRERAVATPLAHLPARTVVLPPLAFGEAGAPGGDAAGQAQADRGFGVAHPAVPAWLLRNVRVHGALGILTAGERVIGETSDGVPLYPIAGADRDAAGGLRLPERPECANVESAYHLLGGRLDSFPVWLLDLVARFSRDAFAALRTLPDAAAPPLVLVPPLDLFWKWESLGPILSEATPRLALGTEGSVFVQRLLYVPRLGDADWATHPAVAPVFDALRDVLVGPPASGPGGRRLFVCAGQSAAPLLANEADLAACAEWSGFERIVPSELSFAMQVQAFAQASEIVAATGPALANLAFCRPGTAICELRAAGQTRWTWRHLAAMRGLRYGCLAGEAGVYGGSGPPTAGIWIDPGRLEALLADRRFRDG